MSSIDTRNLNQPGSSPVCSFCYENIKSEIIAEYNSAYAINDKYPVSKGHILIIPQRHTKDFFSMTTNERRDAQQLLLNMKKSIAEHDSSISGFNVGINCGESAGQTIFHAHIHLIPRRDGDTPNPRGGVRGVIPDKMSY